MRKLVWFLIFLAILTPSLIACGLAYQPFGDGLHYVFVELIGTGTLNLLVGALTGLFAWGAVNGLQAAAVLFSVWIIGGVMWLSIKKFLWDRIPHVKKTVQDKTYQHAPASSLPQVTPEPVPEQIKSESKKEEVVAS